MVDADKMIKEQLSEASYSNPSRSWISPHDEVHPLDVANGQFHMHWAEDNGHLIDKKLHVYKKDAPHLLDGEKMMDGMIQAGWIRKNNKELQAAEGQEHRVQAHVDQFGMGKWHQVKINLKAGGRKEMSFKEGETPRDW